MQNQLQINFRLLACVLLVAFPLMEAGDIAVLLHNEAQAGQVKVFYHIAAINHWKAIVQVIICLPCIYPFLSIRSAEPHYLDLVLPQDQMGRIVFSGLYDVAAHVYCFLLGSNQEAIDSATNLLLTWGDKVVVAKTSTGVHQHERFTLLAMHALVNPGDKVLYLHSKGVTQEGNENVFFWRSAMEYFLIKLHTRCTRLLEEYDTVGVEYMTSPEDHYSGNFWWVSGSYFLSLPRRIGEAYNAPEFYLLQGHNFNSTRGFVNLFMCADSQLYNVPCLPKEYTAYKTDVIDVPCRAVPEEEHVYFCSEAAARRRA